MNNKVPVFGQRRAGVYLLSEIYNPDDVTSSVQNLGKVIPAIGSLVVDDTVGNHNTLYVVYSVDAVTHRSTLVNAGILNMTDESNLSFSYGNNNYKLFYSSKKDKPYYYKTQDTTPKVTKEYYVKDISNNFVPFSGISFAEGTVYYEAIYCYECAVDSRLSVYNNNAVSFSVFKSVAINSTDGNTDVISWFYNLTQEEYDAIDSETRDNMDMNGFVVHDHNIPLVSYTDTTVTNSGNTSSRLARGTRCFYTPYPITQGEKYLLVVNDRKGRTIAQVVLEGQPMLALQQINEKNRAIISFDIGTSNDVEPGYTCSIPRGGDIDKLHFYFDITYNDGVVERFDAIDNIRLFAYGLEDINVYAAVGTPFPVLFKYFVPSTEQTRLIDSTQVNFKIGPTKRYIYKTVYVKIGEAEELADTVPPQFVRFYYSLDGGTSWLDSRPVSTNKTVKVKALFEDTSEFTVYSRTETTPEEVSDIATLTNNGIATFYAKDISNNQSDEVQCIVNFIDKVAPGAPRLYKSPGVAITTLNVSVTITADSDVVRNEYSTTPDDENSWVSTTANTLTFATPGDRTIYVRSIDAAGNVSEASSCRINIDRTEPILDISHVVRNNVAYLTASIRNKNDATLYPNKRIEYRDASSVNSPWLVYTQGTELEITSNKTLIFTAFDCIYDGTASPIGNRCADVTYQISNINTAAPPAATIVLSNSQPTKLDITAVITFDSSCTEKKYFVSPTTIDFSQNPTISWVETENNIVQIPITSNCVIYAYSANVHDYVISHKDVNNIDKAAPTISNILSTPAQNVYTNEDVTVYATFTDTGLGLLDTHGKQYSLDGGQTWNDYVDGFTVTENKTIQFKATDKAGNVTTTSYTVGNIDKTAPTLTQAPTGPTTWVKNWDVIAKFSDDKSGIAHTYYQAPGVSGWQEYNQYDEPIHITTNGAVSFKAIDNAGNESSVTTVYIQKIDTTAPTITIAASNISSVTGQEEWTNEDVQIVPTVTDSQSGVKHVYYRIKYDDQNDFGACKPYMVNGVIVNTNEIHSTDVREDFVRMTKNGIIQFRAEDNIGNLTPENNIVNDEMVFYHRVTKIDKVYPVITLTGTVTQPVSSSTCKATLDTEHEDLDMWYKFSSTDTQPSDWNSTSTTGWTKYTSVLTVRENGTYYFKCVDPANNVGTASRRYPNIINSVPSPTVTVSTISGLTYHNGYGKKFLIEADYHGAEVEEYSTDQSNWMTYEGGIEVTDSTTYYFRGTTAGVNSSIIPGRATQFDTTAPTTSISASRTSQGYDPVTVTFTATDNQSGVQYMYYRISYDNGTNWTTCAAYSSPVQVNRNCIIQFKAIDYMGNSTPDNGQTVGLQYTVSCILVDSTGPDITTSQNTTANTHNNVTVTATFYDISGIESGSQQYRYKYGNGSWSNWDDYPSGGVVMTQNGTIEFTATDTKGNENTVSHSVTNILSYSLSNPTFSYDSTPTYDPVTVTITFDSRATTCKYSTNNSTWTTVPNGSHTATVTVNTNCTVYAQCNDGTTGPGSTASSQQVISNIVSGTLGINLTYDTTGEDLEYNEITAVVTGASGVNIYYSYLDNEVADPSTIASNNWTLYSGPVIAESNGYYYFKATNAGSTVYECAIISNIAEGDPIDWDDDEPQD